MSVGNYIPPEQGLKRARAQRFFPHGGVGNYIPPEQGLKHNGVYRKSIGIKVGNYIPPEQGLKPIDTCTCTKILPRR